MNSIPFPDKNNTLNSMKLEILSFYSQEYPKSKELHEERLRSESGYKHSEDFEFFLDYEWHYKNFLEDYSAVVIGSLQDSEK